MTTTTAVKLNKAQLNRGRQVLLQLPYTTRTKADGSWIMKEDGKENAVKNILLNDSSNVGLQKFLTDVLSPDVGEFALLARNQYAVSVLTQVVEYMLTKPLPKR